MSNIPKFEKPDVSMIKNEKFKVKTSQIPPMDVAFSQITLTDYQLLVATIRKLNELVAMTNSYTEFIEKILDWVVGDGVELAVKDKLEEWLEDGTLENLINETLFNNKLDKDVFENFILNTFNVFVEDTNYELLNKLNENDFNDFIESEYQLFKIKTIEEIDFIGNKNYRYHKYNINGTDLHFTEIIKGELKLNYFKDGKNIDELDNKFIINAGYFDVTDNEPWGVTIVNGVLETIKPVNQSLPYLAWGDDQILKTLSNSSTYQDFVNGGIKNTLQPLEHFISDGDVIIISNITELAQRSGIGVLKNGNKFIFSCQGRTSKQKGLTPNDIVNYLLQHEEINELWFLDGGDSTQINIDGFEPIFKDGSYRKVPTFISFDVEDIYETNKEEYVVPNLSELNQRMFELEKSDVVLNVDDLNNVPEGERFIFAWGDTQNRPSGIRAFIINLVDQNKTFRTQIAIPSPDKNQDTFYFKNANVIWKRHKFSNEEWSDWVKISSELSYNNIPPSNINKVSVNSKFWLEYNHADNPSASSGMFEIFVFNNQQVMNRFTSVSGRLFTREGTYSIASDSVAYSAWKEIGG